jgi:membrane-bound lytic murein transglycosylase D
MKQLFKLLGLMVFTLSFLNTSLANTGNSPKQVYSDRLAVLNLPLTAPMDAQLERKIGQYVIGGSNGTELMLSRAEFYLPIFETYLADYGLPSSLKYLPIAESLLRSRAVSSASAAGLWQIMSGTGRAYGLRVDNVVDERMDAHLSTEAAMKILVDLYDQFGDWNLVLAAYNCGGGRVRKAIRMSGSRDYSKVVNYLPRETRQYVSAYLAAAYAVNFYGDHGLSPRPNAMTDQPLTYVRVYRELSLRKLASHAGLDYSYLRRLNPAFRRGYVPKNEKGYRVTVPYHALYAVQQLLWLQHNYVELPIETTTPSAVEYAKESGFDAFGFLLGCKQSQLVENNDLTWMTAKINELTNYLYERAV